MTRSPAKADERAQSAHRPAVRRRPAVGLRHIQNQRLLLVSVLGALFLGGTSGADERPIRIVPSLTKTPALDANLKKLTPALEIKAGADGQSGASLSARVAHWKDTLFLGIDIAEPNVSPNEILEVEMHFPGAGPTARGYTYRFGVDGKRAFDPEIGPPAFANKWVKAATRTARGWALEVSFGAKSLPRFPAKGPLLVELCLSYEHRDEVDSPAVAVSNCEGGSMRGEVLRVPDAFRRSLKIDPPTAVVALEGSEQGWVGFGALHRPIWMIADRPMTLELLRTFFLDEPRDPLEAHIAVPSRMRLPDRRPLAAVLTGQDPFAENGRCDPESELKMGIYVLEGPTARAVLDWPVASCALGRASSVVLDGDGALTLGFASGATIDFIWSGDHFERTEIG